MADNSSSSSSSFDSSSSSSLMFSSGSSSSYSSSSSSSSQGNSESSFSTSSSSSSSIDSSSSSSSSYLDYHDERLFPFYYERNITNSILTIAFDNQYAYAGTSENGMIIRSLNRFIWENYYQLDDTIVTSLFVNGNTLFAGTAPNGKIYRINLTTNAVTLDDQLNGKIVNIFLYNQHIYACTSTPPAVYKFDSLTFSWILFYKPYGTAINQAGVALDKIILSIDAQNIISYDGTNWNIEISQPDNVATQRRVSKSVFSHVSYNFLDIPSINTTSGMANEDILDIFPYNRLVGMNTFVQDGSTLTIGGSNYGRIFNYNNGLLDPIFDTNSTTVSALLNLDLGVNLAAIDSNLYLVNCGPITTTTTITPTDPEPNPNEGKSIIITSPNGGEILILGQEVDITWTSTKSLNDAVKLDLYKNGAYSITINNKTSNNGVYTWLIPLSIAEGSDYKIYIEWLSAGTAAETDKDFSDADFSILIEQPEAEVVQSESIQEGVPDTSECRGIPILSLNNGETITYMTKDLVKGGILFATSFGRILFSDEATLNAYRTGNRLVYADVTSGFGNTSESRQVEFLYALYKRIAEINEDREIEKWKYIRDVSILPVERITAVFLSPILQVQEDLGFWKQLIWEENKPENTNITICFKTAESSNELSNSSWNYCFSSTEEESGTITRDLNNINFLGRYAQFKILMDTNQVNVTPSVLNLSVIYSTKRAQYFYTIKFALENDSNIRKGLLVASMTTPTNTEITFGINNTNSANWDDYQIISPDSFFNLENIEDIKVGIKLVSYDTSVPIVNEFSIIMSGDKLTTIGG